MIGPLEKGESCTLVAETLECGNEMRNGGVCRRMVSFRQTGIHKQNHVNMIGHNDVFIHPYPGHPITGTDIPFLDPADGREEGRRGIEGTASCDGAKKVFPIFCTDRNKICATGAAVKMGKPIRFSLRQRYGVIPSSPWLSGHGEPCPLWKRRGPRPSGRR